MPRDKSNLKFNHLARGQLLSGVNLGASGNPSALFHLLAILWRRGFIQMVNDLTNLEMAAGLRTKANEDPIVQKILCSNIHQILKYK